MKELLAVTLSMILLCTSALAVDLDSMTLDELVAYGQALTDAIEHLQTLQADVNQRISSMSSSIESVPITRTDIISAALAEAETYTCKLFAYDDADPTVLMIDIDLNPHELRSTLGASIRYCIAVSEILFSHEGFPMLYFRFWQPSNTGARMCVITMRISAKTAERLDLNDLWKHATLNQLEYLEAIDGYSLYKDYRMVVQ